MGRTVKFTVYPGQELTKQQIKRISALKDRPVVPDEDTPEYSFEEMEEMRLAAIRRREEQKKELVSIRVSAGTLAQAKKLGKGYTSFLGRLIENAMKDKDLVSRSL